MEITNGAWAAIAAGTASLGVLAGGFNNIKAQLHRFYSLFVVTVTVEDAVGYAVTIWLQHNLECTRLADINIGGMTDYVRPLKRNQLIALKMVPNTESLWWRGWRPLWCTREWHQFKLRYIRGTFDYRKIIADSLAYFNGITARDKDDRFFVCRKQGTIGFKPMVEFFKNKRGKGDDKEIGDGPDDAVHSVGNRRDKHNCEVMGFATEDIGQPVARDAIDNIVMSDDVKDLWESIQLWYNNVQWYKDYNVPWKYGSLLVGEPGTGKTAFVRAVGQTLNMPVFIFDLQTMNDRDLVENWASILDWAPCIVLVEDIHATFDGVRNVSETGEDARLSFGCLLNTIDGVQNSDGILTFITTNDASKVDKALGGQFATRPGRVDSVVTFPGLDCQGQYKMAKRIMGGFPENKWWPALRIMSSALPTGAQYQAKCTAAALSMLYNKEVTNG